MVGASLKIIDRGGDIGQQGFVGERQILCLLKNREMMNPVQ